jgi:hypothetical protein
VRAEANAALDQGKLVQLSLDAARLPLPFTMLHATDLSGWSGQREDNPWPYFEGEVEDRLDGVADPAVGRRPNPGGIAVIERPEAALGSFARVAALGWAALGTAILLALSVVLVSRNLISADQFGAFCVAAALLAAGLLAASGWILVRTEAGSRR